MTCTAVVLCCPQSSGHPREGLLPGHPASRRTREPGHVAWLHSWAHPAHSYGSLQGWTRGRGVRSEASVHSLPKEEAAQCPAAQCDPDTAVPHPLWAWEPRFGGIGEAMEAGASPENDGLRGSGFSVPTLSPRGSRCPPAGLRHLTPEPPLFSKAHDHPCHPQSSLGHSQASLMGC